MRQFLPLIVAYVLYPGTGRASDICGSSGNSSNVTSWRRISTWAQESHIRNNPMDFQETISTVSGIIRWIGTGGDYWLDETHCVEKFIQKEIDESVVSQSKQFKEVMMGAATTWLAKMTENNVSAIAEAAHEVHSQLYSILTSLADLPLVESEVLQLSDADIFSMMIQIGSVGKTLNITGPGSSELCNVIFQTGEDGTEMMFGVERLLGHLLGSHLYSWSPGVVVCYHVDAPEACPSLPWPWYWVHDTYLGMDVNFTQTKEEADQYKESYQKQIDAKVKSFSGTLYQDRPWMVDVLDSIFHLWDEHCEIKQV